MRGLPLRIGASAAASVATSVVWIAVVVMMLAAAACTRRTPGTCGEDIDCAPGHDCKAGVCVQRQRLRFDDKPARPEPPADATPAVVEESASPPVSGAAPAIPDAGAERPARRKVVPAPPSRPAGPAPVTPAAPAGREPLWKQRLKNS